MRSSVGEERTFATRFVKTAAAVSFVTVSVGSGGLPAVPPELKLVAARETLVRLAGTRGGEEDDAGSPYRDRSWE